MCYIVFNGEMNMIFFIIFLGAIFILSVFLSTPKGKGIIGENSVKWKIGKTKENEKYIFNNYILKFGEKSIQIDHIIISKKGVIVIETKNYAGRIYGNDNQQYWTQVLQYGKVKNQFYNPIKQNNTHCYYIRKLLGKSIPIKSLVVFVKNNSEYIESENDVINLRQLKKYIKTLPDAISTDQINNIAQILKTHIKERITSRQHVKYIRKTKKNIENNICPRCGGILVLRQGKYGDFYGCSNYPKCKFIKK